MALAQGARHSMTYVSEVTFGTTPGTPTMVELRNTGTTLGVEKSVFKSNTIRNDRQTVDLRHGVQKVTGSIDFELAAGVHDSLLQGALFGTWTTNVLKAGTTAKYFSIERQFADISQYMLFTGCMIDELTLDIKPDAIVTGSFSVVGKDMAISGSSVDASPDTAGTAYPFDGFNGTISEGGSAVANVTSLTLSIKNNLAPQYVIGATSTPQILAGLSDVTGTLTAFFESASLLNKFLNETESSVELELEGAGTESLTILLPRIKYTAGSANVQNANDGIFLEMPFQALRDSTEATNIKLTRTT